MGPGIWHFAQKQSTKAADATIEEQLRQAIRESNLTTYAIAKAAGASHIQVARFVRGDRSLVLKSASKLYNVLRLELIQEPKKGPMMDSSSLR